MTRSSRTKKVSKAEENYLKEDAKLDEGIPSAAELERILAGGD